MIGVPNTLSGSAIASVLAGTTRASQKIPEPAPRIPQMVVTMAANGYVVTLAASQYNGGVADPSQMHVATSLAGLLKIFKLLSVQARLSGTVV